MPFSRFTAGFLPETGPNTNLVICVSVSGIVSRTIEAMDMARQAGAVAVALTGNPTGPLAQAAEHVFETAVPPLPDELGGMVVPGIRSYLASQIALLLAAIRIGEVRGALTTAAADAERRQITDLADAVEATIQACEPVADELVHRWQDAPLFEFVGGRSALWSRHVLRRESARSQRRCRSGAGEPKNGRICSTSPPMPRPLSCSRPISSTPDALPKWRAPHSRSSVRSPWSPPESAQDIRQYVDAVLPIPDDIPERFASIVYSIPGELFAASRAAALNAPYFRDFGGGRRVDWANGASAIYDSARITAPQR